MTGWVTAPLGELVTIEIGKTPPRGVAAYWDKSKKTSNVWVSIADLTRAGGTVIVDSQEYVSDAGAVLCRLVKAGSLMMSFKLSIGKLAFAGRDLYTNEAIASFVFPVGARISKEYLFHYLKGVDWRAQSAGSEKVKGVTLSKAKLRAVPITFPEGLEEQQDIVVDLDRKLAMIQATRVNVDTIRDNAKKLFASIRAETLTSNAEWDLRALGEICDVLDSQRVPITKRDRSAGPYPYYGATGVVDYVSGFIFDEPLVLVGEDGAKWGAGERSAFAVKGKCWVNNHAHVLRCHRKTVRDSWIVHYLNAADLEPHVGGLTVPKLNQGTLRTIMVPIPSLEAQDAIISRVDKAEEKTNQMAAKSEDQGKLFDELQKSVLQNALSGTV